MVVSNLLTGGTYSVTFFSDSRLEMLSVKLQNTKVDDLIRRISSIINNKVKPTSSTSTTHLLEQSPPSLDHETAISYIMSRCIVAQHTVYHPQAHRQYFSIL